MTGAAILTVGIKLFARAKIVHVIGWDDFFIFLSLVRPCPTRSAASERLDTHAIQTFSIIASSFVHYGVVLGFGRHTAVVAAEFGNERLFKGAMIQMLGYRTLTACRANFSLFSQA
jgi:hypothetical protein